MSLLTQDEVSDVRKLVRASLDRRGTAERIDRIRKQMLTKFAKSNFCSNATAALMLDVAQLAASAAVSSVLVSCKSKQSRKVTTVQFSKAQAKLARAMQKWRARGEHEFGFTKYFRNLCWQEALKTLHKQLATPNFKEKRHHKFQARLADVRSEMSADVCSLPETHGVTDSRSESQGWRGVNLGGWLLWEPGPANNSILVASLGSDAEIPQDEWTLCENLVSKYGREHAESLIDVHRRSYVTRDDFVGIKQFGANSVRIPFGYWAIAGPRDGEPFVGPCFEFLDKALEWGLDVGLSVVLCFHAAIGFQSPDPPCGRCNENWQASDFAVAANVDILKQVARRYGCHRGLGGICVLNEPSGDLPAEVLNKFFRDAYTGMRKDEGLPVSVQIMLPVFHHEFTDFSDTYTEQKGYSNVVFDVHCYQVFGDPFAGWCHMSLADHLRYATASRPSHPVTSIAGRGERVVVTEFSLAIPTTETCMIGREFSALTKTERELLHRSFAMRQLRAFSMSTEGWFFWCWRDDSGPQWSFSEGMAKGWIRGLRNGGITTSSTSDVAPFNDIKRGHVRTTEDIELPNKCLRTNMNF